ncbi:MAG: T9SS type A sorting domain-containing protein [Flavobacteriales bacterium]
MTWKGIFFSLFTVLLFSLPGKGQDQDEGGIPDSTNFYRIQEGFRKAKKAGKLNEDLIRLHQRWTSFMGPRVYPSGEPFRPNALWEAHSAYFKEARGRSEGGKRNARSSNVSWQYLGPSMLPQNKGGAGRTNCIEIEPGDKDEYWVGTPHGGLWHSNDGGSTWEPMTDQLPDIGVTDLLIDPSDTSIMYLASGDGFGDIRPNSEFWGGTYSMGVLKSTDGGSTWDTTSLSFSKAQVRQMNSLLIHSEDPDTLFATTNNGIYRSLDQGQNWNQVQSGNLLDIDQDPDDPNILYATSATSVYRSLDAGATWSITLGPLAGSSWAPYASLTSSPAEPDEALAYVNGEGFYKSTDNGGSWSFVSSFGGGWTTLGWYTSALKASPSDTNIYYFGGIDIHKSTDDGSNWSLISEWNGTGSDYAHADHRDLEFVPGTDTMLSANDGGIFRSPDTGSTWTDLSEGLEILQIYDMEASEPDPYMILAGSQDNGTNLLKNGTWSRILSADGMGCAFRPNSVDTFYASSQYGEIYRFTNGGDSSSFYTSISNSPFVTKLESGNSISSSSLFTGAYDLQAIPGIDLTNTTSRPRIKSIGLSKYDSTAIYCTMGSYHDSLTPQVHRVPAPSGTQTDITSGLPVSQAVPTDITAHPYHPDTAWVTFSGFTDGEKVYMTRDGGQNWSNISGSLPNIPVNTIVQDARDTVYNSIYVGTDMGVFYRNDTLADWIPVMQNLPHVLVYDLDIHYGAEKIRAATFGRGIWESDLYMDSISIPTKIEEKQALYSKYRIHPNPSSGKLIVQGEKAKHRIQGWSLYSVSGRELLRKRLTAPLRRVEINLSSLSPGTYFLRIDPVEGKRPVVKKVSVKAGKH